MASISNNVVNNTNDVNSTQPPVVPTPPVQSDASQINIVINENPEDLDTRWTRWRCLVCNYTYEGREAIKKCPRCGNEDPDKFEDVD